MGESNSLVIFTKAALMLAEADTIQKAKELKNLALTAADWARRKDLGEEAIQHCRSYALEAERKMGEMLAETERAKGTDRGGRQYVDGANPLPSNPPPTLAELGLSKKESARAQALAEIPRETFDEITAGEKGIAAVLNEKRREKKRDELENKQLQVTDKKYRVIYADPPWEYGKWLPHQYGDVQKEYRTMTLQDICDMPIRDIAHNDCVLFLWVPSPKIEQAFSVIKAWGFEYKTSFVWDKVKHNFGFYNSVRHEFLLIAGRGSSTPDSKTLHDSVISIERSEVHSEKPEHFRDLIDELYTFGNRIELFHRGEKTKDGWDSWGNE